MKKIQIDPDGYQIIPVEAGLDLDHSGFDFVEEGVRDLVRVLWRLGYKTVCSCAGHQIEILPYPWVAIPMNIADESRPLEKLANLVARFNQSLGKNGSLPKACDSWAMVPLIGPAGFAIYLQPLDNNYRRSLPRLSALRKTSKKMAMFMEKEVPRMQG